MIYLQAAPEGATYEKSLDLIGLIFKGGWVMIPLLLLSILTIVIVIERYLFLGKQGVGKKNNFENFLANLSDLYPDFTEESVIRLEERLEQCN